MKLQDFSLSTECLFSTTLVAILFHCDAAVVSLYQFCTILYKYNMPVDVGLLLYAKISWKNTFRADFLAF